MHRTTILFLLISVAVGCSGNVQKELGPGSPTQSVAAAEAFNRGVEHEEHDKAAAVKEYTKAIELDPNFDRAIYNRALANAGMARDAEVLSDLARLKELNPEKAAQLQELLQISSVVYCNQGQSALAEENFEFAINRFTAALLYATDDPGILELRARAHEESGDQQRAAADRAAAAAAREKGVESIFGETKDQTGEG